MIGPKIATTESEAPNVRGSFTSVQMLHTHTHTHPAAAGYFFGRHASRELCNRRMASIRRWKLAHSCQYHDEVDSVGCSR